jgi:hypothetical protein
VAHSGKASIRLEVPAAASSFSGGAVLAKDPQDLSSANALVFWAKASQAAAFDKLGFGLDFDPFPSTWQVTLFDLPLGTEWARHAIPIPDPSKLASERGVLWWADADPVAYTAWLDDVKYDRVDPVALALAPSIAPATVTLPVAGTAQVTGLSLSYVDLDGVTRSVDSTVAGAGLAPAWFAFTSSDTSVATVDPGGQITARALGDATVTARLGELPAAGAVTVHVRDVPPIAPTTAPPAPAAAAGDVIALLAKPYPPVAVDSWGTTWSNGGAGPNLTEVTIAGDPMKKYTALQFVGVEFIGTAGEREIDATSMTHLHVDLWTPDATSFKVKLVDFGADKAFRGGDDTESELTFDAASSPALTLRAWVSLDIPLARFTTLASRAHLAQLVFSSSSATVFVDNVYFHR